MRRVILLLVSCVLWGPTLFAQGIQMRVPAADSETISLAYTANIQGLRTEAQTGASVSAFMSIFRGLRQEYQDLLLVDLGNFIGPTPTSILTGGRFDFAVLEYLGYDVAHISSDDFDIGSQALRNRISEAKVPVITGNLVQPEGFGLPWVIVASGGRNIGFVGVTSAQFSQSVLANLRQDTVVTPTVAYLSQAIQDLDGKADLVVVVTDLTESELVSIRYIPGLDLILTTGGKTAQADSEWISVGFPGAKRAVIARVQTTDTAVHLLKLKGHPANGRWIIDEVVGDLFPVTEKTPRDPATDAWMLDQPVTKLQAFNKTVGVLPFALPNDEGRRRQTPLGNATVGLMKSLTKAALAFVNAGALRSGLDAGPVTEWDLIEAIPYPDRVIVLKLTGEQIFAVMTHSKRLLGEGGYLQFSDKVASLKIVPERTYTVAVPEFLAQGGDGYEELKTAPIVANTDLTLYDLFRRALGQYGTIDVEPPTEHDESQFWSSTFQMSSALKGTSEDSRNFRFYPEQVSFSNQQLLASSFSARLDVLRADDLTRFHNEVEAQYGLWWDQTGIPSATLDALSVGTQVTVFLSRLVFGGEQIADPFLSARLETVMVHPDPTGKLGTAGASRPGKLKVGVGFTVPALVKPVTLSVGLQWEHQPFAPRFAPSLGLQGVVDLSTDLIQDIMVVKSSTAVVSSFESTDTVTVSSTNELKIMLDPGFRVGPRVTLFYDPSVRRWAYDFDLSLTLNRTFW